LPLDVEAIEQSVKKTGRCLVVHEATRTSGFGAELAALVQERCFYHLEAPVERVTGFDTPYPHSLEWAYFPGPVRIGSAIEKRDEGLTSMGKFTFKLPDIGEGIAEAEIVAWHVKVGDRIEEDQPLADMMTDKATVEMESPVAGIVTAVAGEAGDVIAIGSMLVEIETEGAGDEEAAPNRDGSPKVRAEPEPLRGPRTGSTPEASSSRRRTSGEDPNPAAARKSLASPAVRARAKELGVDLSDVKASGGHVRHADLDAYLNYGAGQGYRAPGARETRRRGGQGHRSCVAALPRIWPRPSATSRISAMSRKLTSPRWRRCARSERQSRQSRQADHAAVPDRRDLQDLARFPDDQRPL
jgi:pyruvate/2-oxoglutarate dehydrogenase complex dihydrolipoamide acyltransferase (E2) component